MPFRSVAITTASVASFPASAPNAASGDRLVCIHVSDGPSGMDAPSGGWTLLESVQSSNFLRTNIWLRTATPSEPSSYSLSQGAGGDSVVIIAAISGTSSATPRVASTMGSGTQITTPSVSLPSGTGTELRIGGGGDVDGNTADWQVPAGFTRRAEARSRIYASAILATRDITTPGETGETVFTVDQSLPDLHGITILFPDQSSGGGGGGGGTTPPPTVPALPSDAVQVHYVYEFADLLTDAPICKDLDLHDVSYERRIGEAGTFSASISITDDVTAGKVARILPRHPEDLSTGPGRTVVHVYRNGVVWGTFAIWSASVSRSGRGPISVTIQGASLESYLSRVRIRSDYSYTATDQIAAARSLLAGMQSTARYDIGLQLQAGGSGVERDRTYLASESSTYGERLAELANVDNGFEWCIQTVDNGDGTRTRFWVWGYPRLGATAMQYKFSEPGNVLSWQEDIDSSRGTTAAQARGESVDDDASQASEPLVSDVILAQGHIDAGWPGLDNTTDYSSVSEISTLNAYATWWATNRAGTVRVHQATVRLAANSSFGPGNLGDTVTLMLVNDWWPVADGVASFSKSWRVVGMAFKPPQKGAGQEECTLTFEELPEG